MKINVNRKSIFCLALLVFFSFVACTFLHAEAEEEGQQQKKRFVYNSLGRRDPFVPLVGIKERAGVGGVLSILTVNDISIQGILVNPDGSRSVIINGEIMKEGQRIGRLSVTHIGQNEINVRLSDVDYKLKLYE